MQITLNGESTQVNDGLDLYGLLRTVDLDPEQKGIAVAVNASVIPRGDWAGTRLVGGDRVDVIHAVQGG